MKYFPYLSGFLHWYWATHMTVLVPGHKHQRMQVKLSMKHETWSLFLGYTDTKSTLVQIMAWCWSGYKLNQRWPNSLKDFCQTRPKWLNYFHFKIHQYCQSFYITIHFVEIKQICKYLFSFLTFHLHIFYGFSSLFTFIFSMVLVQYEASRFLPLSDHIIFDHNYPNLWNWNWY